jgi:hypothetical protein
MAQYLDKFRGTIGKRQADQIINLLNKKKNTGQIRSVDEFSQQLDSLIRELTGTVLQPTLSVFQAEERTTIDSERHNYMLDRVQDDLQAGFEEATNIDEVQRAHEALIRDVTLKNLRAGVAELESKITLYEYLSQDNNGFDKAIFSTFRESKEERTTRGVGTDTLFVDPRLNETIPVTEDAAVELVGERLTLTPTSRTVHTVTKVRQIFDATFPQSEQIFEQPGSTLDNIIDNQSGTYWVQSLHFPSFVSSVKVKLEFDLGSVKEIDFIEVEPITQQGVYLEAVHYVGDGNIVKELVSPNLLVESPIGLQVPKIATQRVILTFRNENGVRAAFQYLTQDTLLGQATAAQSTPLASVTMAGISQDLNSSISSNEIKEIAGVVTETPSIYNGYSFTTGFDNVRFGLAQYSNRSIYISSPLELCGRGQVGLRAQEQRPMIDDTSQSTVYTTDTYDADDDDIYLASVEYWVVKQDFNADGVLVKTSRFPILPLGVQRLHHERLLLTERSTSLLTSNDIGRAMFYTVADDGGGGDGNVVVYRNGTVLLNVDGNPVATEGWRQADPITTPADKTPSNGIPMRFRIQIVGALPGDIYTVSYNPMVSSTPTIPNPPYGAFTSIGGLQVVDMAGDLTIRRNTGQIVVLENVEESQIIANTKLFLVIVLRQNAAEPTLTPAVEEYTLMGNCEDTEKFEE